MEIARFWAAAARSDGRDRYDIAGVVGPDEFHTTYPGADAPGLTNNTYTNVMAGYNPGAEVKLEIQRGDKLITVPVTLERPASKKKK